MGRAVAVLECAEDQAVDPAAVTRALADDPVITDVLLVHLETTSGLLNPLAAVAAAVAGAGRRLLLDAMSSFGAVPIDLRAVPCCAVMASANKCLEGVPGVAFVLAEVGHLAAMAGNSPGTSLDLHAQWRGFEASGQWRFTPPTHVLAALDAALDGLDAEGGVTVRGARYARHCAMLAGRLEQLGFHAYLPPALQGPVILTLRDPGTPFSFPALYDAMQAQGIVLYPGKLTREPGFRIGAIGADDIRRVLDAIVPNFISAAPSPSSTTVGCPVASATPRPMPLAQPMEPTWYKCCSRSAKVNSSRPHLPVVATTAASGGRTASKRSSSAARVGRGPCACMSVRWPGGNAGRGGTRRG